MTQASDIEIARLEGMVRNKATTDFLNKTEIARNIFLFTYEGYQVYGDDPSFKRILDSMPEDSFCRIVKCYQVKMIEVEYLSSAWVVNGTALHMKDMVFGDDPINGKVRFIIKADKRFEEFCKSCHYDIKLNLALPKMSNYGGEGKIHEIIIKPHDFIQDDIGYLPTIRLGGGWSDDRQMAAFGKCFKGTIEYFGGIKSTASLNSDKSFDEIQKSLTASAGGKMSAMLFSGSAEANYAKRIKDSRLTKSFYFLQTIEMPTAIFQPDGYGIDALNAYGKEAYNSGPQQFRHVCGNRLISEVHQGVSLYVTLKLHFSSHSDQNNFEIHSKIKLGGMASVKLSIKNTIATSKINGKLEFIVYQSGGDASQLAKVFGKCKEQYCITICSLDKLDACDGILNGVIAYAQNNLPEQIDFKNGNILGSAVPISYTMPKIIDILGLDAGESVLSAIITSARKFLGKVYTNQTHMLDFVNHALNFPSEHYFPEEEDLKNLQVVKDVLKANIKLLESVASACYVDPTQCADIHTSIAGKLMDVHCYD